MFAVGLFLLCWINIIKKHYNRENLLFPALCGFISLNFDFFIERPKEDLSTKVDKSSLFVCLRVRQIFLKHWCKINAHILENFYVYLHFHISW